MTSPHPGHSGGVVLCETADCRGIATVYVTCEGEGAYPYCKDCGEVMLKGGWEEARGPVNQVTDELLERAWRAFDRAAMGGADTFRDEPWFLDAIRAVIEEVLPNDATRT